MATVHDVAAYILSKQSPMSAMKLQKLCYYSQAWHAVWESKGLFEERIEAWAYGPVSPALYRTHAKQFIVEAGQIEGDPTVLTADERESIDVVLGHYGNMSAQQLSDQTHSEEPWQRARTEEGITRGRSNAEITLASMEEFYSAQ